jgi:hypothetical protein
MGLYCSDFDSTAGTPFTLPIGCRGAFAFSSVRLALEWRCALLHSPRLLKQYGAVGSSKQLAQRVVWTKAENVDCQMHGAAEYGKGIVWCMRHMWESWEITLPHKDGLLGIFRGCYVTVFLGVFEKAASLPWNAMIHSERWIWDVSLP